MSKIIQSLMAAILFAVPALANASPPDVAAYARVLEKHVENGAVDYAALKADRQSLDQYLTSAAAVTKREFQAWEQERQIAFLINLYNAATLKLIINHYPVESIKDIGGWFSGPWSKNFVRLFDRTVDLDHIEHDILRKDYDEPRIHFALVCAAKGCPPLLNEPYTADWLGAQLEERGKLFMQQTGKNHIDTNKGLVHLSPIFKWFKEDFGDSRESVLSFVAPYFPESQGKLIDHDRFLIRYTDYDWTLNDK